MSDEIISYLLDLDANNNRDWCHSHKEQNRATLSEFEELIRAVMLKIGEFDDSILRNEPRNLTFKLARDTRFSHDKTPYNPTFRCHIAAKGKLSIPTGYSLSIRPNNRSFLGGGLFADMLKACDTANPRAHIGKPRRVSRDYLQPGICQQFHG